MDGVAFYLVALVGLLLLSAFFSGTEAALFSLNRSQLRSMASGPRAGREIARLLRHPRKLLVSILLGNLIVNVFTTSVATALMIMEFGERGVAYAFVLMSALLLLFGEILPKSIAMHSSRRFAVATILPLRVFHTAVLPFRAPLSWFSDAVINVVRGRLGQAMRFFTWDELMTVLRIARSEGEMGMYEYELLSNVLEFRQKIVKEIMTPSIRVQSVSVHSNRKELIRVFAESGFSRVPVHGESTDDIVGVLHIKDLIRSESYATEGGLRSRIREPYFAQEATPIAQLYIELQNRKEHVAIVIDEFGSFAGIVTIEDILEELVGDIRDARDPRTEQFMRLDDDRIVVSGAMEIDHFNSVFDVGIEDDEHETVAGYVIGRLGRIPREGESFELDGLRVHIVSAQPNRVRKMRVERLEER